MVLILIACSKRKTSGGVTAYPGSELEKHIPSQVYGQLLEARSKLGSYLELPLGPDLGSSVSGGPIP